MPCLQGTGTEGTHLQGFGADPQPEPQPATEPPGLFVETWVGGNLVTCSALELQDVTRGKIPTARPQQSAETTGARVPVVCAGGVCRPTTPEALTRPGGDIAPTQITALRMVARQPPAAHTAGAQPTAANVSEGDSQSALVAELQQRLTEAGTRSRSLEEQLSRQAMLVASLVETCQEFRLKARALALCTCLNCLECGGGCA